MSRGTFCWKSFFLNRVVSSIESLIQLSTYPFRKSFNFVVQRQNPSTFGQVQSELPPASYPGLRGESQCSTRENVASAPGSERSPRRVTVELGARDVCRCPLGVGAKPRLGQWSSASARPGGWTRRVRKNEAEWDATRAPLRHPGPAAPGPGRVTQESKSRRRLAFPKTPRWSRAFKSDQ